MTLESPATDSEESAPTPTAKARRTAWHSAFARPRGLPVSPPLRRVNRFFSALGPGLITGAADDDPSGIGTYSQAGAAYGPVLLWMALYILPLVIVVQEMCGRIGLVTGQGIAGVVRRHYNRQVLYAAVALLFLANTINIGADLGAMVASIRLLVPGLPFVLLLVVLTLTILGLEIFIPYRHYAQVLKFLTFSLFAYIITGFIIQPNWGPLLLKTLVPTIQFTPGFLILVVALLGTTISPYLFFWQASEEVEEQELHHRQERGHDAKRKRIALGKQLRALRLDTVIGLTAASVTFWFIVMTTGLTLHAHGITNIQTADQAAAALTPLVHSFPHAGELAKLIFALGIVGTGLLAIPVLAGSAAYGIAEATNWREGLERRFDEAKGFYAVIALATLIGLALNFFIVNPVEALVYSAVINGIIAVPLLGLIMLVANNKKIMGEYTNRPLSNIIGWLATGLMGIAAIVTVVSVVVALFVRR